MPAASRGSGRDTKGLDARFWPPGGEDSHAAPEPLACAPGRSGQEEHLHGPAHWTDSFSHGELLRAGCDERLEVDPARLRFLFQGVLDRDKRGKRYGDIPWRLGLLEPAR